MPFNTTESYASFFIQESTYVGTILHDILYGIELYLYFNTIHIFLTRKSARRKSDIFYALFSTVVLLLTTILVSVIALFGQEQWAVNQDQPKPIAFGYINLVAVASVVLQLMTDGLMTYRCRIVWDSHRATIIPFILWLATLALGTLLLWATTTTSTTFFRGDASKLALSYFSISVSLHAILTCMICYRLVCCAREMKECLGKEHAAPYFCVAMLLVESVLPYTLSGIAFLVSFGIGSQTEIAFSYVYLLMMGVSPQMLILRVAEGHGWQKETIKPPASTLQFGPGPADVTMGSSDSDGTGMVIHLEALPSLARGSGKGDEE